MQTITINKQIKSDPLKLQWMLCLCLRFRHFALDRHTYQDEYMK